MNTPLYRLGLMSAGLAVVWTTGCAGLKRAYPDKHAFALETRRAGEAQPLFTNSILAVRVFGPPPLQKGSDFIYRMGPNEFAGDFYHVFFVRPEIQLADETAQWLKASGLFAEIVPVSSRLNPHLILEGHIDALHGDMTDRSRPRAVLGLDFMLIDESQGASRLLFHKNYDQDIPLEKAAPAALVDGWNKALAGILTALEQDLRQVPAPLAP